MSEETIKFQAEVGKLLDIVVHSLYSNKEIFLRELISNASDACDRLRYQALTQPELLDSGSDFAIRLAPDAKARTLTIADNGIGMNRQELIDNLGTIARSGTAAFLAQLSGDAKKDVSLIGQFGVGFYSAFMVASKVEVVTRKAGEKMGWRWISSGQGEFSIAEDPDAARGCSIILHLREGEDEFLQSYRLGQIVRTYSDHIALPVILAEEGKDDEVLNTASALWTRPKNEITSEQYQEFYHHVAHAGDEPWLTLHYRAEGAIEYTALLFVPGQKPFDLFHPDRKQHVKLYVNRVFITDDCAELLPPYLRFLRGVVDSADLPLNVSREMLQHNPILSKIRTGLVKRVLSELKRKATDADGGYQTFWDAFGPVLKEGVYEDFERKGEILEICRFRSSMADDLISLDDYLGRMKEGQEAIYYITGDDADTLRKSPQLEGFLARGIEVLLMTDPVDEFWTAMASYKDKPLRSVTQSGADLAKIAEPEKKEDGKDKEETDAPKAGDLAVLIAALKETFGDQVKDVRASERLTSSPVCLVADGEGPNIHLERLLRQHGQTMNAQGRVLEVNPKHVLIGRLIDQVKEQGAGSIADSAWLLLDQARIVEGDPLPDPISFAQRLSRLMERV